MENSNQEPSRLFLRLVLAVADSRYPIALLRRRAQGRIAGDEPDEDVEGTIPGRQSGPKIEGHLNPIPESAWGHLESLRLRFESELTFADSCLAGDPPRSRIEMLLANSSELRKVAILQRFIEKAYSYRLHQPGEGLQISDSLIAWTRSDPSPLVAVIRSRALVERGNFLRILGESAGAYAAFAEARKELEANGTGDPLELARYQELLGTLERDCDHLDASIDLLRKALAKVRKWGDPHTLQRVLSAAGLTECYKSNYEQAEKLWDEAMRVEEPDSLLLRYAAINRMLAYHFSGDSPKAYRALLRVRASVCESWLRDFPVLNRIRVLSSEGQILDALRIDDEAIGVFRKARELAIGSDFGGEACHISLELARNYAAQERYADVRRELAFGLPFCSERRLLDRYAREGTLLLQAMLDHQGRLGTDQFRAVSSRLTSIERAPLKPLPQSPFADLQL